MTIEHDDPLLQVHNISKTFKATRALHNVSFCLNRGRSLALFGENGAGKSTLMKVLSGACLPDAGHLLLDGKPYMPKNPADARQAGVTMIYQELNLIPHLSVVDNIMLGREAHLMGIVDRQRAYDTVMQALIELEHPELIHQGPVGGLSPALQQIVEIARAIAFDAKVVIFDEPTSSLSADDVNRLLRIIAKLKSRGTAIICISHNLEELDRIADDYLVLRDGCVVGTGQLKSINHQRLVEMMSGRIIEDYYPHVPHQSGEVILKVFSRPKNNMELDVRRGEILGLAGLVGAGRTRLLRTIYGLCRERRLNVLLYDSSLWDRGRARIQEGMGMVSENRKSEGVALKRTIKENIIYTRLYPYHRFGWILMRKWQQQAEAWMRKLQIKSQSTYQRLSELSGGNQQKVALARVMHQLADIYLLDEPTRGVDISTKTLIYRAMGELAAQGKSIIFASSYFPELMAISDRIAVMAHGKIAEIKPTSEWTERDLIKTSLSSRVQVYAQDDSDSIGL